MELNPNYATGHHWFAELLTWQGRFDEALRESEMARRLDPLSLVIATDRAAIFYYARQYDRAIEEFRAVQEMDSKFPRVHVVIYAYVELGKFEDALADLEVWRRDSGDSGDAGWIRATQAYVYGRSGQADKARAALEKLEHMAKTQKVNSAAMVWGNLGVRDKDGTLGWLEKAYAQRSNAMTAMRVDPAYDPLRNDARFQRLLRRVGLDR